MKIIGGVFILLALAGCGGARSGEPAIELSGTYVGTLTLTHHIDASVTTQPDTGIPTTVDGERVLLDVAPGSTPPCVLELEYVTDCELGFACGLLREIQTCTFDDGASIAWYDGTAAAFDGAGGMTLDGLAATQASPSAAVYSSTVHFDGSK